MGTAACSVEGRSDLSEAGQALSWAKEYWISLGEQSCLSSSAFDTRRTVAFLTGAQGEACGLCSQPGLLQLPVVKLPALVKEPLPSASPCHASTPSLPGRGVSPLASAEEKVFLPTPACLPCPLFTSPGQITAEGPVTSGGGQITVRGPDTSGGEDWRGRPHSPQGQAGGVPGSPAGVEVREEPGQCPQCPRMLRTSRGGGQGSGRGCLRLMAACLSLLVGVCLPRTPWAVPEA